MAVLPRGVLLKFPSLVDAPRPFLGRSVLDGRIRYSSVSQIRIFDPAPNDGGGCPRRWAFAYIYGKKETKTEAQKKGSNEYAKQLEILLKTGEDTLTPVLRAARHYFPRNGSDIESEKKLGDIEAAIQIREAMFLPGADIPALSKQLEQVAGLVAAGIPLDGAADFRHRRGEYIDENGSLVKEVFGSSVVEIGDLKTTSRINDHVSHQGNGKLYRGYAKSVEEILKDHQMVSYGKHATVRYPDITHVRLSHIYAQTKNGFAAAKRTGLLTVDEVLRRFEVTEGVMRDMVSVAASAKKPEDVPTNIRSCNAFNRECTHAPYCDRPKGTIDDLFQIQPHLHSKGALQMNSLFDTVKPTQNGVASSTAASPSLFGAPVAAPPPPVPPPPPMSTADYQAAKDAELARLKAQEIVTRRHPLERARRVHGRTALQRARVLPERSGIHRDRAGAHLRSLRRAGCCATHRRDQSSRSPPGGSGRGGKPAAARVDCADWKPIS